MGLLTGLFERRQIQGAQIIDMLTLGTATASGIKVSEEGSLRSTAVYACVRIIAESIASLPLVVLRRQGRNKRRATEHPLYPLLHDLANPHMTAFEWREYMLSRVLLYGNAYSEIEYDKSGRILALWPLLSDQMESITASRDKSHVYHYRAPDHTVVDLPAYKVHHLKGLNSNGVIGYSPIQLAMQAVGLTLATEEFGSRFFGNGARPGVVLKHPGRLSGEGLNRLRNSFNSEHQGLSNAHRIKILEEGMDLATIGIPPEEAQFLETRRFQVSEIARIFRVPPHMLADLERATFSNIEHQSLEFVIHTLRPWLVRHEQAIQRDLMANDDRAIHYPKYIVEGLLRGDTTSRYAAYATAISNGWMTRNEARELEDLNPDNPDLDAYLVPLNMLEVGQEPPEPAAPVVRYSHNGHTISADVQPALPLDRRQERLQNGRRALMRRNVRLFEDAARRLVNREIADIRRVLPRYFNGRAVADFEEWLADFYTDFRGVMPGYFRALMLTYAEDIMAAVADELGGQIPETTDELRIWVETYLENYASVYTVGSEKQLRAIMAEVDDPLPAIQERLDGWDETKPVKNAVEQAFEAGNALVVFGYRQANVRYLRWVASGDSCPLCIKLDGKRIPIAGSFVEVGDTVTADGVDPLPIVRTMRHGPLHGGCDCVVIAG